ncbi:hypothetical protein PLICRDRAFT_179070 [Plicaturopsis crispa FD-325 SS-3]|uniref:Mid2 domain-containing protein n=1 Tax=Plicaturopsis crispa FD-325 SS-3 TaxID=944288 RepID=A0A0C9T600_PLICR|nr:hypothetical protein PLICRDRAFT_179070 [Plicaturopsis crispa FD-325 SS-3]
MASFFLTAGGRTVCSALVRDIFLLFVLFLLIPAPSRASPNVNVKHAFQWKFSDNRVSTSIQQCSKAGILVQSSTNDTTAIGTPPYYMIAFEPGAVPTTSFIGNDPNNLTWQVDHKAGAKLLLSIADADGNAGGSPPQLYTVTSGDSSCLPSPPTSNFGVTANVTDTLQTCQPWGLTIRGGAEPYTITLAQTTSPLVTNVTLGMQEDLLTFVNRADPNQFLIASVSDANGQFGTSTVYVRTQGPTVDAKSCGALVTTSGNATQALEQQQSATIASAAHKREVTIVAVVLTIGLLLLIGATVAFIMYRRRRRAIITGEDGSQDTAPRAFQRLPSTGSVSLPSQLDPPQTKSINSLQAITFAPGPGVWPPTATAGTSLDAFSPINPPAAVLRDSTPLSYDSPDALAFPARPFARANSTSPRPSMNRVPNPSWTSKVAEANARSTRTNMRRAATATALPSSPASQLLPPSRSRSLGYRSLTPSESYVDGDAASAIVFQHQDGGLPVVRELPPPYVDRSTDVGEGSSGS